MKNYLLMTATVTPPTGEFGLARTDTLLRLREYVEAFKYYLDDKITGIDGIIFIDNSNHALDEIRQISQSYHGPKQIEILSFNGLDYPAEYSRGYGELKLIEYAYVHSKLMQRMEDNDRFWKVTGRLKVITLNEIIKTAPQHFDLLADFRYRRKQVDTRLLACSMKGYKKYLYGQSHEMVGSIIESWLFKKLTPLFGTNEGVDIVTEFRVVPKFVGFAGSNNLNYMAPRQKLIYFSRTIYLIVKYFFKPH